MPSATSAPSRARMATARSDRPTGPTASAPATAKADMGWAPTFNSPTRTSNAAAIASPSRRRACWRRCRCSREVSAAAVMRQTNTVDGAVSHVEIPTAAAADHQTPGLAVRRAGNGRRFTGGGAAVSAAAARSTAAQESELTVRADPGSVDAAHRRPRRVPGPHARRARRGSSGSHRGAAARSR